MTYNWRVYRPAIWLTMLGIAVMLVVNPAWLGAPFIGAAIGVALRIRFGGPRRPRRDSNQPAPRKRR